MIKLYDYSVSFEAGGENHVVNFKESNIHEVLRKIKEEYPSACMFQVKTKVEIQPKS